MRPFLLLAAVVIIDLALASSAVAGTFDNLKAANPQPAADMTIPGLAVNYVYIKVRHVDEIEEAGPGAPGKPLAMVDYQSGSGDVLTSEMNDGVGALIRGYIKFPTAGRWLMATQSNDGVRVRLAGQVIIEDPDVHTDQFSANAELNIAEPGWYELSITYFERKNTSTLQLYWQKPGDADFEIVPADAFCFVK
ncbi:MAG: PA14 domain-containing protein [Dongiaceae bacterium]